MKTQLTGNLRRQRLALLALFVVALHAGLVFGTARGRQIVRSLEGAVVPQTATQHQDKTIAKTQTEKIPPAAPAAPAGVIEMPPITLPALPNGAAGQLYSHAVAASPNGSYSYVATAGSLPPGLTLYGAVGTIFGYPASAGTYNFTITATDSNNCTSQRAYTLTITAAGMALRTVSDFDGDGKSDLALWRGDQGDWLIVRTSDGQLQTIKWGASYAPYNDVAVNGDFDGDGNADPAVFRRGGIQQGGHFEWAQRRRQSANHSVGSVVAWRVGSAGRLRRRRQSRCRNLASGKRHVVYPQLRR